MKDKINTYIATLLITIVGSGAALLIVHVATTDALASAFSGSDAGYFELQKSAHEKK